MKFAGISLAVFLSIVGAILLGAMSPGPSFVLASKIAIKRSRAHSVSAAIGMGFGGAIFAILALGGLVAVLQQVDWLFLMFKVCGSMYLFYIGIRIWQGASEPLKEESSEHADSRPEPSLWRSFSLGFVTQIANPKTAVVYASIFAVLMPNDPSNYFLVVLPPAVLLVEAGWYPIVAILFSMPAPQRAYFRSKTLVDRIAGTVLGALGVRLDLEEAR